MRSRTLALLATIATLAACHSAPKPDQPSQKTQKNHLEGYPQGSPAVRAYSRYLTALDTTDLSTPQPAYREFKRLFTGQPAAVGDTGFILFYTFLRHLNTDTAAVQKLVGSYPLDTLAAAEEMNEPLSARHKKARQTLADNFFIVHEDEGMGYLVPGWRLMPPCFASYITPTMNEVIAQSAKEDKEGFQNDAGLTMQPRQLAARTVWWERFMARNPHHIYLEWAKSNYNLCLYAMVAGMDNTPVTDYDSADRITPFFDTAYQIIRDSFPDSRTNTVIAPYWQAIRTKDTVTRKRIRDSLPSL
ncbi:MAG TPA: hypothetical protein VHE34_30590 [Puia sp.]|uniref:hypothetical protein n=1 Tax=Puia sp. TaxID=2045100 RepID=UPI002CD530E4|nr:hypothetical protein [Puia sp.]HVU99623.1 hypothetical protein [Puia sp.]